MGALNMHNKVKHPEEHKGPILSTKQKKSLRNYGIMIIIVLVIGGFFFWRLIPPKNGPIIRITPDKYDFKIVSQSEGTVSTTLSITNDGNEPLVLTKMATSCGCTSASVVYAGVEGPKFGMAMHGTNPKDWKQVLQPGDSAELKIYYNPNVHKEMRGAFARSVMIYSNDPRNKVEEVKISGVQTN